MKLLPGVVGGILGRQVGTFVDRHDQSRLLEAVFYREEQFAQLCSVLIFREAYISDFLVISPWKLIRSKLISSLDEERALYHSIGENMFS